MPNGISSDQTSAKRQAIHANANAPNDIVAPGAWQGKIEVSPRAIATVAGRAVAECYGVVGIAARRARFGVVEVRFTADHIAIEVYVVLEHGLRITEIAHNIMQNVKFAVERTLGLRVVRINVNVLAL